MFSEACYFVHNWGCWMTGPIDNVMIPVCAVKLMKILDLFSFSSLLVQKIVGVS